MLIKSTILSDMSGSLAGSTAARNRGGLYLRNRTTPLNPNTAKQVAIRNAVGSLVSAWKNDLTATQRTAWETYAANTPTVNRLGDSRTLTGLNWYVACNVPRLQDTLDRVDDGPTTFGLATLGIVSATVTASGAIVSTTYDDTAPWVSETGAALIIYVSPAQSPTINFYSGRFNWIGDVLGDSVSPPASPASNNSSFTYTAGDAVFLRYRLSRADGRLSAIQTLRVIAT